MRLQSYSPLGPACRGQCLRHPATHERRRLEHAGDESKLPHPYSEDFLKPHHTKPGTAHGPALPRAMRVGLQVSF